jgi:hypothetical protein
MARDFGYFDSVYDSNIHESTENYLQGYFVSIFPMSEPAVREMVYDWMGAGRAQKSTGNHIDWYKKNKDKLRLHPDTRNQVEALLEAHQRYIDEKRFGFDRRFGYNSANKRNRCKVCGGYGVLRGKNLESNNPKDWKYYVICLEAERKKCSALPGEIKGSGNDAWDAWRDKT